MTDIKRSLDHLIREIENLPFSASIESLHSAFMQLVDHNFAVPGKSWLQAFELAAIAKFIYLYAGRRGRIPINWVPVLNGFKFLWKESEENYPYPDDPDMLVTFALRFVYQQTPWRLTPRRLQWNLDRTKKIYGRSSDSALRLRRAFENASGLDFDEFLELSRMLYEAFKVSSRYPDFKLVDQMSAVHSKEAVGRILKTLTATRASFRRYYESFAAKAPIEVPYEFNPLLRYPILYRDDTYHCAYPELINYAATRGLYFLISDAIGAGFAAAFSTAFEEYVVELCSSRFPSDSIVTEADERKFGWTGKTNDISVVLDNAVLMIECKNSGLFSLAKKSANPTVLIEDIRKNLANSEKRKGLFQLADKIEQIRAGKLPAELMQRYGDSKQLYPVLLTYDEIWFANRGESLKNLIDAELLRNGITALNYQVWHVEELEMLIEHVSAEAIPDAIKEKFTVERYRPWDLSTFVAEKYGAEGLNTQIYVPAGESKALSIIRNIAGAEGIHSASGR